MNHLFYLGCSVTSKNVVHRGLTVIISSYPSNLVDTQPDLNNGHINTQRTASRIPPDQVQPNFIVRKFQIYNDLETRLIVGIVSGH